MTISAINKPRLKNDFFLGDQPAELGIGSTGGIGVSSTTLSVLMLSVTKASLGSAGLFKLGVVLAGAVSSLVVSALDSMCVAAGKSADVAAVLLGALASFKLLGFSSFMMRS